MGDRGERGGFGFGLPQGDRVQGAALRRVLEVTKLGLEVVLSTTHINDKNKCLTVKSSEM